MTQQEFRQWFTAHRAAFSSVGAWLKTFPKASEVLADSDQVTQEKIASSWFATVGDQPLPQCLEATKRLARGDDELPKTWDLHPQRVRQIAKRIALEKKPAAFRFGPILIRDQNGEWIDSFRCALCRDDGHVLCFHGDAVEKIRNGKIYGDRGTQYTMVVCCTCDAGQRRQQLKHAPPAFDEHRHVRIESNFSYPRPEDIRRLQEFCTRPENYEAAFEEFA